MNWARHVAESFGQMSHAEIALIEYLARQLPKDAVCVNIGTGPGTSIIALLETRKDLICFAVDDHQGIGEAQLKQASVSDRVVELWGDSHTLKWEYGAIDWLCIDGDHSYAGLSADIANWLPHVRGLVLFHDYNDTMKASRWREVKRAVDEWAGERQPVDIADSLIAFNVRSA